MAKTCLRDQGVPAAEVPGAGVQPLSALRPAARLLPPLPHVPPLPARPRAQGADPGPDQGQLVRRRHAMTDPIADLLTRIRNGAGARKASVDVPWSRHKEARRARAGRRGLPRATPPWSRRSRAPSCASGCATIRRRRPVITGIRRVSRPSLRVYVGAERDSRRARAASASTSSRRRWASSSTARRARAERRRRGHLLGVVRTEQSCHASEDCPIAVPDGREGARRPTARVRVEGPKGKLDAQRSSPRSRSPSRARRRRRRSAATTRGARARARPDAQAGRQHGARASSTASRRCSRSSASATAPRCAATSLLLTLGYSHPIVFQLPPGVTAKVERQVVITLEGGDRAAARADRGGDSPAAAAGAVQGQGHQVRRRRRIRRKAGKAAARRDS